MNTNSRVIALSLGMVMAAAAAMSSNAVAGAKGQPGNYGQPSAAGRVVVGTLPGGHPNRGNRGHRRHGGQGHGYGQGGLIINQPAINGPRNYYFEQRTGQGIGANAPSMPSIYFNQRTNRGIKRRHGNVQRGVGNRASARRGLTEQQVRELIDQLPPRNRNAIVDPRTQAADRESSGISFGPRSTSTAAALATRKRAPTTTQGYRQGAPRFASEADLPRLELGRHGVNQYIFAEGTWFVPHNGRLQPTLPPVGLTVNRLPNGFAPVSRGGREYFTADGVYLRRFSGGYVVVAMPGGNGSNGNNGGNNDGGNNGGGNNDGGNNGGGDGDDGDGNDGDGDDTPTGS